MVSYHVIGMDVVYTWYEWYIHGIHMVCIWFGTLSVYLYILAMYGILTIYGKYISAAACMYVRTYVTYSVTVIIRSIIKSSIVDSIVYCI